MNAQPELTEDDVEAAPAPDDAKLKRIATLAGAVLSTQERIAKLEADLKAANAELRQAQEVDLPLAMKEAGTLEFTSTSGAKIAIKEEVYASIAEANRPKAFEWLEKFKHGSIIKHEIKLLFPRDEEKWAAKFMRDLDKRKRPIPYKRRDFIEPQTLKAFVKEQDLAKTPVPDDLFGVYRRSVAVITPPKE